MEASPFTLTFRVEATQRIGPQMSRRCLLNGRKSRANFGIAQRV